MSLYNMINGVNPAAFLILPMLNKHPDEYPRFRDCWAGKPNNDYENTNLGCPTKKIDPTKHLICVYTRVGGGNRENYQVEIDAMRSMEGYLTDYDDDFDCTFATFEFTVPEKWQADYDIILDAKTGDISNAYRKQIFKVYPKLKDKMSGLFEK